MSRSLPRFDLVGYASIIEQLRAAGYEFRPISQMRLDTDMVAYLRHDVDSHLAQVDGMARLEAKHGIAATYYVPLTQHFNVLYAENRRILRTIQELGHEIGLHYDLETYPADPGRATSHLCWEASILASLVGTPIHTISTHQPYKRQPDPFRSLDEYVHPHDPRYQQDLLYVSDSCRAWRDESLLSCFGQHPPRRLVLNTHPELWLDGTIQDRMPYLDRVLTENGLRQHKDYFDKVVRQAWLEHPAPGLHDARERMSRGPDRQ